MKYFTLLVGVFLGLNLSNVNAQTQPVQWNFSIEKIDDSTAYFVLKTDIAEDWRVFGKYPYLESTKVEYKYSKDDIPTITIGKPLAYQFSDTSECTNLGPTCLSVNYFYGADIILETVHSTKMSETYFSKNFDGEITYYKDEIELRQKIKYRPNQRLKGDVYFMTCNHEKCHPPTYVDFDIMISE